jgi:cystathionine beta-lyase/cystathionine gamma-synthase
VDRVDLTDTQGVRAAVDGAALLWLETPSNPLLDVADLAALCAAGRRAGAIVGADNTFATPLLQQPLALGADVVVHSATKFIGGHSNLLSGIAVARQESLAGRLRPARRAAARELDRLRRRGGDRGRGLLGRPAHRRVPAHAVLDRDGERLRCVPGRRRRSGHPR